MRAGEVDLQAGQGFDADHVVVFEDGAFVHDGYAADEAVADGGPLGSPGNVNGEGPNDVADFMSGDDGGTDVAEGDENPVDGEEINRDYHADRWAFFWISPGDDGDGPEDDGQQNAIDAVGNGEITLVDPLGEHAHQSSRVLFGESLIDLAVALPPSGRGTLRWFSST